jgi:hypothetical protein
MRSAVIGVDLDNTIISYDSLFHRLAVERGLVEISAPARKKWIRDRIRELPEGDIAWQELQAEAYGPRIGEAEVFEGVAEFFERVRAVGARAFVVSHKTEHASHGDTSVSLRVAAMGFMRDRGLLAHLDNGESDVFFASTRAGKCAQIGALNCSIFIDDLIETFEEAAFPSNVHKVLFDPAHLSPANTGIDHLGTWNEITNHVFERLR